MTPTMEEWSLNHRPTRKVPLTYILNIIKTLLFLALPLVFSLSAISQTSSQINAISLLLQPFIMKISRLIKTLKDSSMAHLLYIHYPYNLIILVFSYICASFYPSSNSYW